MPETPYDLQSHNEAVERRYAALLAAVSHAAGTGTWNITPLAAKFDKFLETGEAE